MKREVYGKSIRGATHVKNGAPCQDYCKWIEISESITVMAVADGHGSAKCPRSDRGSMIAVNAFETVMKNYLNSYGTEKSGLESLVTFLNREGDLKFAQDVCVEWQSRVKNSFYKNRDESCIGSDGRPVWKKVYSLYGTTLLGMLATDEFVFAFQIGDGDIMLVNAEEISPVLEAEKFLGTETHSLSKEDAWRKAVSTLQRKNTEEGAPCLYILSTDGFANSHASEADFQKTCRGYYDAIGEHGFSAVTENLGNWLEETSRLGCGDDVTVLMAYFAQ